MDALWGFLILYSAAAVRTFCMFGLGAYYLYVVPRTEKTWIRAFAILGFALGAALWPLVMIGAFATMLADATKGGSPCR